MPEAPSTIGRYQVRERIGEGGMGALYLALDPAIDRLVALKLLRVTGDEMRARFLREARSAGRLQHHHIVTVHDVGEHDGQPFIAMEFVRGETVAALIQRRAPLSVDRRLQLIEQLCDGLHYAHQSGLVHRDIKPANLMVVKDTGALKILDFGIARGAGDSSLTEVGTMVGTPNYMSPEQAAGDPVDHRSDIFAVGTVLYELLTYRQAFPGKEWHLVLRRILEESPEPLADVDPELPERLQGLVGAAMMRDPAYRYQDLRQLADDLRAFRSDGPPGQLDQTRSVPTPVPASRGARPATDRARLHERRRAKLSTELARAREALAQGDLDAAQDAAEEASLLDVDDSGVVAVLDDLGAARQARQFDERVGEARARLDAGELTDAMDAVTQALALKPSASDALNLRTAIVHAVGARDRAGDRQRRTERTLDEARQDLTEGRPEAALRGASEVLALAPGHTAAETLKQEALAAVEAQRRRDETERAALDAIARARAELEAGDRTAAIARLESVTAVTPAVAEAIEALRARAGTAEGVADTAAGERTARWATEQVATVRRSLAAGDWDAASAQLDELRARAPGTADLEALTGALDEGRLAATRRAEVDDFLAAARRRKATRSWVDALTRVDAALALLPEDAEALELRRELEELATKDRQRQETETAARRKAELDTVESWLAQAESALRTGRLDDARRALDDVNPEVATTEQNIRFSELTESLSSRLAEVKEAAAAKRRERVRETRQRVTQGATRVATGAGRVAKGARRAAGPRTWLTLGGGLVVVTVGLWITTRSASDVGSTPAPDAPTATAGSAGSAAPLATPGDAGVSAPPTEAVVADAAQETSAPTLPDAPPVDPAEAVGETTADATETVAADPGAITAIVARARSGDVAGALDELERLRETGMDVGAGRAEVDAAWHEAARERADDVRALAGQAEFAEAVALAGAFMPAHGFVDAARDQVEADWAVAAAAVSREALQRAADGDHAGAVALLEGQPGHATIEATLQELNASPSCPDDEPLVADALAGFRLAPEVTLPEAVRACGGAYRVEVQSPLVRFGARCERASATAFVPVLCEGESQWSAPAVMRFVLGRDDDVWMIQEIVATGAAP